MKNTTTLFSLLILISLTYISAQTSKSVDVYYSNSLKQGATATYSFDLSKSTSTPQSVLTFTLFPCQGGMDWYVKLGSVPTTTDYDFVWLFPDGDNHDQIVEDPVQTYTVNNPSTSTTTSQGIYYLSVYAHDDHGENAEYQYYAGYVTPYPFPDASGVITVAQSSTQILVSWTASTTPNVEYCVYAHPASIHDEEDLIHGSPCAVEGEFELGCTSSTSLDITDDMKGVNEEYHFEVVVTTKSGGFSSSYDAVSYDIVSASSKSSRSSNTSNSSNSSNSSNNNSSSSDASHLFAASSVLLVVICLLL